MENQRSPRAPLVFPGVPRRRAGAESRCSEQGGRAGWRCGATGAPAFGSCYDAVPTSQPWGDKELESEAPAFLLESQGANVCAPLAALTRHTTNPTL